MCSVSVTQFHNIPQRDSFDLTVVPGSSYCKEIDSILSTEEYESIESKNYKNLLKLK